MMKDVTFGQYYPASSFAHKCDPRFKILFLILFIVAIFICKNFYGIAICAVVLLAMILCSNVPFGRVLKSVKGILFLLLFTAILNLFFYSGENTIILPIGEGVALQWGIINITWEGLWFMLFLMARLFMLVMCSAILTLTTTPVALTDGIESLFSPLKIIHFPAHELALIMSIALRFIPTLMDETERIMNAQKARGADFETGGLVRRAKAIIPILIPLLISAFRRAEELGDAMDARCYTGSNIRTKYKKLKFSWRDGIGAFIGAGMLTGIILLNIYLPAL